MSPISSRKRVPLWASSALPTLRPVAPVKAPFSCPNSSFSSSASGIAAQLMATKGPWERAESWCSARLITSLPVPLSPCSSTVVSVPAARCSSSIAAFRAGSSPITLGRPKRRWWSSRSRTSSVISLRFSTARSSSTCRWSVSTGFIRKSAAPSFIARTASSTVPKAVITTTGVSGSASRAAASTSKPLPAGNRRSVSTTR